MEASSKQTAAAESLDRERVIDSIVAGFEAAWRGTVGQEPRIEDLLTETKEIPAEILFPRLLAIELEQLKTRNIFPDPDSYYRRFPTYTNVLDTIFDRDSNTDHSTQVSSETPCESLETFSRVIDSSTEFADSAQFRIREPDPQEGQVRAIGDYQILDVLGQGGMGIVYRAHQTSADRVVALKVIRPERLERHSEEKRRQIELRFQTEARAVARLQHDNLLQVYDVGVENGVHYFSMQYVEGKSLSQIIRDAPLANRKAAEYLEQITRAVAEAHRNGILHRDLKPDNILVDTRTDRPLLADFGLAKLLEEDVSATAAGEVFGSPPYMSPEQASDSASVTVSGDVYSLGATLYCMLTGRPPFQAATLVETLRQVVNDDPVSPRELNPEIDLDLETICLKCLEKEPSRRYSTAEALADDLGRYLRREPVLARPLGRVARFCRLCLRNKLVTTLASLAVVFLLSALVILFIKNIEITDKNTEVTDALSKAQTAQQQSDRDFDELREVVDKLFTEVSEHTLLNQPGMQPLRKDLLTKVIPYYQKFVNSERKTPEMEAELGNAYYRMGYIQEHLGSLKEGVDAYRMAIDEQKKLLAKSPSDPRPNEALGRTLNAQARILHKLHRLDEAADFYREAVACRNDLVRMNPGDDEYRRQLANSIMNLGLVQRDRGEIPLAAQQFEQASSLRQGFESLGPEFRRDLSRGYYNWGDLRLEEQRLDDAVQFFEQSAVLLESLLEDNLHSLEDRYRLALCRRLQGDAASGQYFEELSTKSYQQALKSHEHAMESLNILIFWNPDVPQYLEEYANIELNLGFLLQHQGQFERAEELFTDAKEKFTKLVAKVPHEFNYRFAQLLATKEVELTLARRTDLDDRTAQTRKVLEEVQQKFQELQSEFPDRSEVGVQLDQIKDLLEKLNASNPQPTTPTDL